MVSGCVVHSEHCIYMLNTKSIGAEYLNVFITEPFLFGWHSVKKFTRSHQIWSIKKVNLKNLSKFTGKHLCQSLFFNKPATFLKKRLWHRCFAVNFAIFLRTPFFTDYLWTTASKCYLFDDNMSVSIVNEI